MSFRILTFAATVALIPLAAAAQDTTQTSVDWDGRYEGVVPCASCPGIDMSLELMDGNRYRLTEQYQESDGAPAIERGSFTWAKDGSTITLDDEDNRAFFVSEGYVDMVGADGKPTGDQYRLTKAETAADPAPEGFVQFIGDGGRLVIAEDSIKHDEAANTVSFDAVHDFEHEMDGGHRSMQVQYLIDCKRWTMAMPTVAYFKGPDATGDMLAQAKDNNDALPMIEEGADVVRQAADQYCH